MTKHKYCCLPLPCFPLGTGPEIHKPLPFPKLRQTSFALPFKNQKREAQSPRPATGLPLCRRLATFGLRRWTLDLGSWTLDLALWILDLGSWTLDLGLWILDFRPWTSDCSPCPSTASLQESLPKPTSY